MIAFLLEMSNHWLRQIFENGIQSCRQIGFHVFVEDLETVDMIAIIFARYMQFTFAFWTLRLGPF